MTKQSFVYKKSEFPKSDCFATARNDYTRKSPQLLTANFKSLCRIVRHRLSNPHDRKTYIRFLIAAARRFMPSSISSGVANEKLRRIVFCPLPSQWNADPIT